MRLQKVLQLNLSQEDSLVHKASARGFVEQSKSFHWIFYKLRRMIVTRDCHYIYFPMRCTNLIERILTPI